MADARSVADEQSFQGLSSDDRFNRVLAAVTPKPARMQRQTVLKARDGARFGYFKEDARTVSVSIDKKIAGDFGSYLLTRLPELYEAFRQARVGRT
jgi:ParB family transcriptional regulator, chromosome partitioning protein